ncbi:uncharacterized protein LOC133321564 [Musca vetustissima]|uniref:uncharacterized protein LOC133321564 n=1 Tax=Musca vetustissima TaxID=27455 RepID=UPI002AB77DDF|nr:uncharacterized protein LOC133321564 [Musca vetustissima]
MNPSIPVVVTDDSNKSQYSKYGYWCCNSLVPITTLPAIFIFISAGMHLALGLGFIPIYNTYGNLRHFEFSWFIGVIIGAVACLPLLWYAPKKCVMLTSSVLILIDGIILTSAPTNAGPLLAGRYLNGIAVGLATITFLMHVSEIASNSYRGSCSAIEQFSLTLGIAIQMIYGSQWSPFATFPDLRVLGILDILFALAAGLLAQFCFIESPIVGLLKKDEALAWNALAHLELPKTVSTTTKERFMELKEYVNYEDSLDLMDDIKRGALPLAKMILFRSMILAFSFSLPLSEALNLGAVTNHLTWPAIVAACLRIFGGCLAYPQIDYIGRKLPSLVCAVIIGGLLIGIGGICQNYINLFLERPMAIVTSLCLLVQFFAGAYAPFTSAYLGEAFPLKLKGYFIAVCVVVEQLIHIIVICTFKRVNGAAYIAPGVLTILAAVALLVTIPETRKTSLKEAQGRFRHLLHLRMY